MPSKQPTGEESVPSTWSCRSWHWAKPMGVSPSKARKNAASSCAITPAISSRISGTVWWGQSWQANASAMGKSLIYAFRIMLSRLNMASLLLRPFYHIRAPPKSLFCLLRCIISKEMTCHFRTSRWTSHKLLEAFAIRLLQTEPAESILEPLYRHSTGHNPIDGQGSKTALPPCGNSTRPPVFAINAGGRAIGSNVFLTQIH